MKIKSWIISLVILGSLAAGAYWYNMKSTEVNNVATTESSPIVSAESQIESQGAAIEKVRQELEAIQQLPPEKREKALEDFRKKLMIEHGIAN